MPEAENNSPYSPCPVESNEELLRAIFYPDHITENNKLKPEAIPSQDLKVRGFSIQRQSYLNSEIFDKFIQDTVAKKEGKKLHKIFSFICESVRGIKDKYNEDTQAFIVIDDAQSENDIAHAVIKLANAQSPSKIKALRILLIDKLEKANKAC